MVDFNNVKLKELLEMKFGVNNAQQIITTVQEGIGKKSKSQIKEDLWQNVIKPKLAAADADSEVFGLWSWLVELCVFIPPPPEGGLNI